MKELESDMFPLKFELLFSSKNKKTLRSFVAESSMFRANSAGASGSTNGAVAGIWYNFSSRARPR